MLSFWHMLLLLLIVVILFGPSRLEKLGPSLGKAIRGFKEGLNGELDEDGNKKPTKTIVASTTVVSSSESDSSEPKV